MESSDRPQQIRLAELLGALSLAVDLGFDQPMEHVLRQCWIALRLADCHGLPTDERATTYYTSLLTNVGCHTDAHEQARWFGDDVLLRSTKYSHGIHGLRPAIAGFRRLGSGRPPIRRLLTGIDFVLSGHQELDGMVARHAEMASRLAQDLNLPQAVQISVGACYEQWDGKGWPGERSGEGIPAPARIAQVAEFIEVAHRTGGVQAAQSLAHRLSGSQFDPRVVQTLSEHAGVILSGMDDVRSWDLVIVGEPGLSSPLCEPDLDNAMAAIADFIDLKTPYMLGHAREVDWLVLNGGRHMRLDERTLATTRRAALAFGWGRLGISNTIWDKPGPLGPAEMERIRLHPYLTERVLSQSPRLAEIGAIAGRARERLDGSGYPRGLVGDMIGPGARLLAVADAYQSMIEPRPYRSAFTPSMAATLLHAEVRAGRMDGVTVEAVLGAAGHRLRPERPAGLTARESEILLLVARGMTSKEIAHRLSISPKTVRNHIEHVYLKIGVSNRVTASLYAIKHGLFSDPPR